LNVRVKVCVKPLPAPGLTLNPKLDGALMISPNVAVPPAYMALSVTGVEEATVPAVTVKVVEVAPDATVTNAGTVAAEVFELESVTRAPPIGAAAVKMTVPVPDWPLTIMLGAETPLRAAGAGLTVRPNVSLTPVRDAVKVTGVGVATPPAVTGNVVEVEPCGTVTVDCIVTSTGAELRLIVVPPLPAARVNCTVQVVPADGLIDVELQEKPFKLGVWRMVTVPLLVEVESAVPVVLAEIPFVSWTTEEASLVDADNVKFTVATTPVAMGVSLRPHSIHVAVPVPYSHEIDLFVAADPAATTTEEKSVVE